MLLIVLSMKYIHFTVCYFRISKFVLSCNYRKQRVSSHMASAHEQRRKRMDPPALADREGQICLSSAHFLKRPNEVSREQAYYMKK